MLTNPRGTACRDEASQGDPAARNPSGQGWQSSRSAELRLTVRYSQKGSSSLGPVGKCAKLEPMEAMNWPKKELPFRMGTPMVVGTVHLCAPIRRRHALC